MRSGCWLDLLKIENNFQFWQQLILFGDYMSDFFTQVRRMPMGFQHCYTPTPPLCTFNLPFSCWWLCKKLDDSEYSKKNKLTSGFGTKALPGIVKQLSTLHRYWDITESLLRCLAPVPAVNLCRRNKNGLRWVFCYEII